MLASYGQRKSFPHDCREHLRSLPSRIPCYKCSLLVLVNLMAINQSDEHMKLTQGHEMMTSFVTLNFSHFHYRLKSCIFALVDTIMLCFLCLVQLWYQQASKGHHYVLDCLIFEDPCFGKWHSHHSRFFYDVLLSIENLKFSMHSILIP